MFCSSYSTHFLVFCHCCTFFVNHNSLVSAVCTFWFMIRYFLGFLLLGKHIIPASIFVFCGWVGRPGPVLACRRRRRVPGGPLIDWEQPVPQGRHDWKAGFCDRRRWSVPRLPGACRSGAKGRVQPRQDAGTAVDRRRVPHPPESIFIARFFCTAEREGVSCRRY